MLRALCSFLLTACLIASPLANAKIRVMPTRNPSEQACFQADVDDALARIRAADSDLAAMVDALKNSPIEHRVYQSSGLTSSIGASDRHQDIVFNPSWSDRFEPEGVCIDPAASLLHELAHALDNEGGTIVAKRETKVNYIAQSEIDATNAENLYRRKSGLCPRTTYGGMLLPGPQVGICANPFANACRSNGTRCIKCCCWVYGKTKNACVIDNLNQVDCYAQTKAGSTSAGCYSSPCNFPGTNSCP